jgi:hypothetical protein
MKLRYVLAVVFGLVGAIDHAQAQQDPMWAAPIYNWSYNHRATTVDQGYMLGAAAVNQSIGQTNYANSMAAVNFAEAQRRQLENSRLYVQVLLERREMVRQYLSRYGNRPPSREQIERVSHAALPDRLSPEQFDADTGRLVWPHVLRDEAYAPFREHVDQLIAMRTPEASGDGGPWQRELSQAVDSMKRLLKQNIDTVTPQQYANAKWFLISLDYEGRMNPAAQAAAAEAGAPAVGVPAEADLDPVAPAPADPNAAQVVDQPPVASSRANPDATPGVVPPPAAPPPGAQTVPPAGRP